MNFEKIREELLQVEASIMEDKKNNQGYKVPSALSNESLEIDIVF